MTKYLLAQLSPLRWLLYAYAQAGGDASGVAALLDITGESGEAWESYAAETASLDNGALHEIREKLHLDDFAYFALKLALASELLPAYRAVLDLMGGLTLSLALRVFSATPEEALSWKIHWRQNNRTNRPLFGDIETPLSLRPVVLDALLGGTPGFCEYLVPAGALPASLIPSDIPKQIAAQLTVRPDGNIFSLSGAKGSGRKYWLMRFLEDTNGFCVRLKPEGYENYSELETYLSLTGAFLYIENMPPDKLSALIRAVRPANVFVAVEVEDSLPTEEGYSAVPLRTPVLGYEERLSVWRTYLPETPDVIVSRYSFSVGQIQDACRTAKEIAAREGVGELTVLHTACKRQLTHQMERMAQKARTTYTWDDLILPPAQKELLFHIRDRVLYGETVRGAWGLDSGAACGNGVRALFSGPPGTGKTMAAQILSRELDMEMYTVNLSALVSKYIGETEKNLEAVFGEAAKSGGVLFFDEADALFGKRGEQKDSHDKYANMQTAFLLQRFETYEGVALLATNLTSNLDPAFLRRIQVRVEFSAPDIETREKLWRSFLKSPNAPLSEELDIRFLAETFELTGSAIRNTVLTAAFLAAAGAGVIGMKEILRAVGIEYAKLDKVLTSEELGEWGEANY